MRGDGSFLVAAVNKKENQLDVLKYSQGKWQSLSSISSERSAMDGVCLAKDQTVGVVYAFVIQSDLLVEQHAVYDLKNNQSLNQVIRTLPLSHGIVDCAADESLGVVYFAEEQIGVWHLPINPESEIAREPVAFQAPFGQLNSTVERLFVLTDGSLLMSQPESEQIAMVKPGAIQVTWLPHFADVELIAAKIQSDKLATISVLDDKVVAKQYDYRAHRVEQQTVFAQVLPSVETKPVKRFGDAADDPAIWVNPLDQKQSLVLGTDKQRGLAVYDLSGNQLQFIATGKVNNVDVKNGFKHGNNTIALAAASNRDINAITLYSIDYKTKLVQQLIDIQTDLSEVYGLCMAVWQQQYYVLINDKDGRYQQYHVTSKGNQLRGKLV